jgi:hypothetical protein
LHVAFSHTVSLVSPTRKHVYIKIPTEETDFGWCNHHPIVLSYIQECSRVALHYQNERTQDALAALVCTDTSTKQQKISVYTISQIASNTHEGNILLVTPPEHHVKEIWIDFRHALYQPHYTLPDQLLISQSLPDTGKKILLCTVDLKQLTPKKDVLIQLSKHLHVSDT